MMSEGGDDMLRLISHREVFQRGTLVEGVSANNVPFTGPLVRYESLTGPERSLLNSDFLSKRRWSELPDRELYLRVMHSWGVMCPHPQDSREYEGLYRSDAAVGFDECAWFRCGTCECLVVNR